MHCDQCGTPVDEAARFCSHCGKRSPTTSVQTQSTSRNVQGAGPWSTPIACPPPLAPLRPPPPPPTPTSPYAWVPGSAATPLRPYGEGKRNGYAALWSFYTLIFVIGGFIAIGSGNPAGLLTLGVGSLAGTYAYRIWTFQARRLWLLIFF